MKINFTQEHFQRMWSLLMGMLLNNETINNKLGQPLNVVELLHTTSINGLNSIRTGSSPVGVTKVTYNLTTLYTISSLG